MVCLYLNWRCVWIVFRFKKELDWSMVNNTTFPFCTCYFGKEIYLRNDKFANSFVMSLSPIHIGDMYELSCMIDNFDAIKYISLLKKIIFGILSKVLYIICDNEPLWKANFTSPMFMKVIMGFSILLIVALRCRLFLPLMYV